MIKAENLTKEYRSGITGRKRKTAVSNVSFEVSPGRTLGIIGKSGCGKSTLSLMLSKLIKPTSGKIYLDGKDVTVLGRKETKAFHREVQIIFQNPETALDPNKKIGYCILEAIRNYDICPKNSPEEKELLTKLIRMVDLQQEHLDRYCWELSGGQIQRAVLARVIALEPKVLIADEPTSMLDVSVQAGILSLIKELQKKLDFAMIFVSHDLDVVRAVSDDIIVMNDGKVVERGTAQKIFEDPSESYTRELMQAFYYDNETFSSKGEER
ncbi:MAG: ATP-binding cassette domain-containing protein [Eubacteriales bacterium]|nr:ATP-binding cassette domain-containing protein [Eubacteriales bacterium]